VAVIAKCRFDTPGKGATRRARAPQTLPPNPFFIALADAPYPPPLTPHPNNPPFPHLLPYTSQDTHTCDASS
jgi:hypothetical protein